MAVLVYCTAENRESALTLGRALVGERLAACANVLDGMTSVYHWQGELEENTEVVLILKTQDSLADALTERIRVLHPYAVPCVLILPIQGGNSDFLRWIADETTAGSA